MGLPNIFLVVFNTDFEIGKFLSVFSITALSIEYIMGETSIAEAKPATESNPSLVKIFENGALCHFLC